MCGSHKPASTVSHYLLHSKKASDAITIFDVGVFAGKECSEKQPLHEYYSLTLTFYIAI
jgi:hypothetical protein